MYFFVNCEFDEFRGIICVYHDYISGFKSKIQKGSPPASSFCLWPLDSPTSSFIDISSSELSTIVTYRITLVNKPLQKTQKGHLHLSSILWLGAFCQYSSPRRIFSSSGYGFSKSIFVSLFMLSKLGGAEVYFDNFEAYDNKSVNCTLAKCRR